VETSLNPESFVSSLHQDAILGVPQPLCSSTTVVSNLDHFEPPNDFNLLESDLVDDVEIFTGRQSSNTGAEHEIDYSAIFFKCSDGPPIEGNIGIYNSQLSSSSSGGTTSAVAEALLQLGGGEKKSRIITNSNSSRIDRSSSHTDAVSDPLNDSWRPQVDRAHQFDVSLLAPKSIFYGDRFPRESNTKIRLGVSSPKLNKQPIDEIIAVLSIPCGRSFLKGFTILM